MPDRSAGAACSRSVCLSGSYLPSEEARGHSQSYQVGWLVLLPANAADVGLLRFLKDGDGWLVCTAGAISPASCAEDAAGGCGIVCWP